MRSNSQSISCCKQRGLSLVELLISLALSSLVIVALFSFFSNFKANSLLQGSIVDNQHELRILSDFIRTEVQKAGYVYENSFKPDPFKYAENGFMAGSYLSGSTNQLSIRYQSDGSIRDCVGNQINAGDVANIVLRFNKPAGSDTGTVECSSGGGTITVLDGVTEMRFSYLEQGGTSYQDSINANLAVAVKFNVTFERDILNSNDDLVRKYSQVAALRNVF